jgi:hypothetical protein
MNVRLKSGTPVVPDTWEAEVEGSLKPMSLRHLKKKNLRLSRAWWLQPVNPVLGRLS